MNAQFDKIKAIFIEAVEKYSSEQWPSFLDQGCGDDNELRHNVEMLLEAHAEGGSLLEKGAFATEAIAAMEPITEAPGTFVGPYEIREQIGEGGMGVVYVAEQLEPVRRKVALKIIKPGMDTRQVISRFEAERQALAMMDHPNIAKVLDVGTTESGRPYFVMELVRGIPITAYCDKVRLTTAQRLDLFLAVCQAVQHAHQKGIIHRDIKPDNVMVTMIDGSPVPKVIDFGVAKAVDKRLTEDSIYTHFTQMVGTPLYMSPEQAELTGQDVDTRSDIYSLGVLLYELLTGSTPFDSQTLSEAGFDEMRRIIREDGPPRPSDRISTLAGEALSTVSLERGSDPRKLSHLVRGDLDWIVMKALDKDRTRRYETANALAADVMHYLHDEPVEARPPSVTYKARKFARRNKRAFGTAAVVTIALLVGTFASVWQAIQARDARQLAEQRLIQETEARRVAQANSQRAADNLRLAIAAVDEMYTEIAENRLASTPRMQPVRREILEKALNFYLEFASNRSDTTLDFETAKAWRRVGEIRHSFNQNVESEQALLTAVTILERLADHHADEPRYRHELATTFSYLSKVMSVTRQYQRGERYCRQAIMIQRRLAAEFPDETSYQADLAKTQHQLGHLLRQPDEAIEAFTTSSELYDELLDEDAANAYYGRQLAHDFTHWGRLLHESGNHAEAEGKFLAAVELLEAVRGDSVDNADVNDSYGVILADTHRSLGSLLRQVERLRESESSHRQAIELNIELVRNFPVAFYRQQLAQSHVELAKTLQASRQTERAQASFQEARTIFRSISAKCSA